MTEFVEKRARSHRLESIYQTRPRKILCIEDPHIHHVHRVATPADVEQYQITIMLIDSFKNNHLQSFQIYKNK